MRRTASAPPPPRTAHFDFERDDTVPFGVDVNPDLPWCPGAIPAIPQDEVAFIFTNIGPSLLDTHGSPRSLIARSAVEALGDLIISTPCAPFSFGGNGAGSALHCTATSSASFTLTIQFSFLDFNMRTLATPPFARECGAQLSGIYIVDDSHLAALQGALPAPPLLLLGRDCLKVRALEELFALVLRAGFDRASDQFVALWSHPQQRRIELPVSGTYARRVHQGADLSTAIPFDTPPADSREDISSLAPHLELFSRDGPPHLWPALQASGDAITPSVAASQLDSGPGTPRSKQELLDRIVGSANSAKLAASDRLYFDFFCDELVEVMWRTPRLFGDASPRGVPLSFEVTDGPPVLGGMHRHTAPECVQPLFDEVMRLQSFGFCEPVPAGPNGGPPGDGFCVNPIVLALKQPDPGAPANAPRAVRFCLDMSEFNSRRLASYKLTHLPDIQDLIKSFSGMLLYTNADMSSAFMQRPVAPHLRKYLGFVIINPGSRQRTFFQFCCGIFGLQSIPQDFQRVMENLLCGTTWDDSFSALRIFIDNLDLSSGPAPGEPTSLPTPSSEVGRALAARHLASLAKLFALLDSGGFAINLKKSFWMLTTFHSMGLVGNGTGFRINPERLSVWTDFTVPTAPSLKWLRTLIGMFVYSAPYMHLPGTSFVDNMDPLYSLLGDALRLKKAAATDSSLRSRAQHAVADSWTPRHTACVEALRASVMENSTLAFYDPLLPLFITADSSNTGTCATALQFDSVSGSPCIVFSYARRWATNQVKWSIGIRELFAFLCFLRKYRRELRFARCVFRGDHLNHLQAEDLEHLFVQRILVELLDWPDFRRRWHIRGEVNILTDFGSRYADTAPTFLEDSPPGTASTHYFDVSPLPATLLRRVAQPPPTMICPPSRFELLTGLPGSSVQRTEDSGLTASSARRVVSLDTPSGIVEHFNNHSLSLSALFLDIIASQGTMNTEDKEIFSKLRRTSTVTLRDHSIMLVAGCAFIPPSDTTLIERLLDTLLHCDSTLHCGLDKADALRRRHGVYIHDFERVFTRFYASCKCQHARTPAGARDVSSGLFYPRYAPLEVIMMDFASLPPTAGGLVGVCLCIDSASRALTIYPAKDFTCTTALAALKHWATHWNWPKVVMADGGSHFAGQQFRTGAGAHGTLIDIGTPLHPQGRGLVEGAVGRLKRAIVSILPQGRLELWHTVLDDIAIAYMACPQAAMAGFSPLQYLTGVNKDFGALFGGTLSPQQREDALQAVTCLRSIVDFHSELKAFNRAAAAPTDPLIAKFTVGEWVLVFNPTLKENSLSPAYQGPYRIKAVETGANGKPTGWYTVAEIMAGDSEAVPREAKPLLLHSNRLWPFDHSRTDADAEHARRLGPQDVIVERVLEGPSPDGKFLIKWRHVEKPRWEWPAGLAHLVLFQEYCERHGIVLGKGGRAIVWQPNLPSDGAPAAIASKGPEYIVCTVCKAEVHRNRQRILKHAETSKHKIALAAQLAAEAAAAAVAVAPPVAGGAADPKAGRPKRR